MICRDDSVRREKVRAANWNGLDELDVGDDRRVLTVTFLGKAPEAIETENVRIEGGHRIRDLAVVSAVVHRREDPEVDDELEVTLDRVGDESTYTLRLVALDAAGRATDRPFDGFDVRYDRVAFSFMAGCPSELDCAPMTPCPPAQRPTPDIDYLAKDYASLRRVILDRLALIAPGWQERHVPDLGLTLVELLAYVGDQLSYHQDAVATEAYLDTARRRISIRRHARLVDYRLHEGCNARAFVSIETENDLHLERKDLLFVTALPEEDRGLLSEDALRHLPSDAYEAYEPLPGASAVIELHATHSCIEIYTWGDHECCLPAGTTSATLRDDQALVCLERGDLLLLEEVKGARTGREADTDRSHRQVVRLTEVRRDDDELYGAKILHVRWSKADSLRFPLCVSSVGADCEPIEHVAVARANVIAVGHGRTEPPLPIGSVPIVEHPGGCDCHGHPTDPELRAGPFAPELALAPLTYAEPFDETAPATALDERDPQLALPQIRVTSTSPDRRRRSTGWTPALDLLSAHASDRRFVVEVDDDRRAHLRFGDGKLGAAPDPGAAFTAVARIGNGAAGNVGAEAIAHAIVRNLDVDVGAVRVRNPLPATGGSEPEALADARLLAPHAFRDKLERAITAADYALLARRDARLQGATAGLLWNGSWYEARVAIDPLGTDEPPRQLLDDVHGALRRFRRIGHDLEVVGAGYVALDIELRICLLAHVLRSEVRREVLDVLGPRRLPDGRLGLFHPDNEAFAGAVAASRIVAAVQAIDGVESVEVTRLQRLYEPATDERESGLLRLGRDEIARLDNDPGSPEHGRLVLVIGGGR